MLASLLNDQSAVIQPIEIALFMVSVAVSELLSLSYLDLCVCKSQREPHDGILKFHERHNLGQVKTLGMRYACHIRHDEVVEASLQSVDDLYWHCVPDMNGEYIVQVLLMQRSSNVER